MFRTYNLKAGFDTKFLRYTVTQHFRTPEYMTLCWKCLYLQYHGTQKCMKASGCGTKFHETSSGSKLLWTADGIRTDIIFVLPNWGKQAMCGGCKKNDLKSMTCYGSLTHAVVQQNARAPRSINSPVNSILILCTSTRSLGMWISYPSVHQQNSFLSYHIHPEVFLYLISI